MLRTQFWMVTALLVACLFGPSTLRGADLVQPLPDTARYQLSPPRQESDRFGRTLLIIDYQQTQPGKGSVGLRARSNKGMVTVSAFIPRGQKSGSLRLQNLFGSRSSIGDVEFYLAQPLRISASKSLDMLVSNLVRVGNPGSLPAARAVTADEKKAMEAYKANLADDTARKPTKSYPVSVKPASGTVFVPNTAEVKNGMELSACYSDKWHPVRVLSENPDGTINVSWDTFGSGYAYAMSRGELTIQESLLASLGKHPTSKYPSVQPNWSANVSEGSGPPKQALPSSSVAKRSSVTRSISQFHRTLRPFRQKRN